MAQNAPDPGHARVALRGLLNSRSILLHGHGAELVDPERLAVPPRAGLPEQRRPLAVEANSQGNHKQERKETDKPEAGQNTVEDVFAVKRRGRAGPA